MINGEVAERFTSGILPSALRAAALSRGVRRRSKGGGLDGSLLERFQTAERSDAGPTGAPTGMSGAKPLTASMGLGRELDV